MYSKFTDASERGIVYILKRHSIIFKVYKMNLPSSMLRALDNRT